MSAVVFLHAHPDDEAIFTGGTMALLAEAGHRVVLVVATRGELGGSTAEQRMAETCSAAELLGVSRVEFLRWRDSGMADDPGNDAPDAFCKAPVDEAAVVVVEVLAEEDVVAVVTYDEWGIYGHPDHVHVHRVGRRVAELLGTPSVYDVTVDREYLHFVETHLVVEAGGGRPEGLGLAASSIGMPTLLIDLAVDVSSTLERKRAAMAAHGSQIPETASAMQLPTEAFAAVYGFEWFMRVGAPGPVDALNR